MKHLERCSRAADWTVVLIAALALVGWQLGSSILKSWTETFVSMSSTTASLLILAAISLEIDLTRKLRVQLGTLARIFALMVAGVAALKLTALLGSAPKISSMPSTSSCK